jgi:hypothetical protein
VTPPPGSAAEPTPEWSGRVSELIDEIAGEAFDGVDLNGQPKPFYNPLSEPLEADTAVVKWSALSGTLRALDLPAERRWQLADEARLQPVAVAPGRSRFGQDEYCEWAVARDAAGEITEMTFTTEVGEWFDHLAKTDRPGLLAAYKEIFGTDVEEGELFNDDDVYVWQNPWNLGVDGKIAHLAQENNTLGAAIRLAAEASVARTRNGRIVTDAGALMACNGLGNGDRFSDPSIATTINAAVVAGARIALAPPLGLFLAGIRTEGMRLPAGHEDLEPADLWQPQRGAEGRVVRARFSAPNGEFSLAKVLLDGKPIATGAQLAERVEVTIAALVHQAGQEPVTKICA